MLNLLMTLALPKARTKPSNWLNDFTFLKLIVNIFSNLTILCGSTITVEHLRGRK